MTGVQQAMNDIAEKSGRDYVALWNSPEWKAKAEARKIQLDVRALDYLRKKFPEVDDTVFFTGDNGMVLEHIKDAADVCDAALIDVACANCQNGECRLPEKYRDRKGRPVALIRENQAGVKYLCIRWTCGITCRHDPLSGEFGRMFRKSGLAPEQLNQNFESYQRFGVSIETQTAKAHALMAAKESTCLILAGKPGTGKTHLAIAIAIYAMTHGRQAIFRLVSELIDELRDANREDGDNYSALMKQYKEVPCLILDDMGKERTTKAGVDYVYQIVDYRYRHNLQTIMTTNAPNEETLSLWGDSEYIMPMVSRIKGRGAWVTIEHADDYRQRQREQELTAKKKGAAKNVSK